MPFVTTIVEAFPPTSANPDPASAPSTPHAVTPRPATPLSPRRILEELSFEPLQRPQSRPKIEVQCELLRVELRCPPPSVGRKRGRDVEMVRSGIAIVDLHEIKLSLDAEKVTRVAGDTALLFFLPAQGGSRACLVEVPGADLRRSEGSQACSFLSISGLAIDPTDTHTLHSAPPTVVVRQVPSADLSSSRESLRSASSRTTTCVDSRIPLLRTSLDKSTLDGLQLFADDLAQWSGRAFGGNGDESELEHERNPKMIGSRYFGAKSFTRPRKLGSDSSESGSEGASAVTFKVVVTDGESLALKRRECKTDPSPISGGRSLASYGQTIAAPAPSSSRIRSSGHD